MLPFLKKRQNGARKEVIFTGTECKMYIPKYFFEDKLAEIIGENCKTVAVFWFEADGKKYQLQLGLPITFSFSDQTSKKGLKIIQGVPPLDYTIFILKNGDLFLTDAVIEQSHEDTSTFITKMVENAKLPSYIKYNDSLTILYNTLAASGIGNLGITSVNYEFLLSILYRNKYNTSEEFRFAYNGRNNYDGKLMRITKIPENTSVFTSIAGEDLNTQLLNSVVRTREKKPDRYSPLEKVLKY